MNKLVVAIAGILATSPTLADDEGFLFGIGAGQVDYDVGELGIDDKSTGWKVYGGYRFNPNFTVEAAYIDGGSIGGDVGPIHVRAEADVFQLSATGGWWWTESFGSYVRGSWNASEAKATATLGSTSATVKEDDDTFGYGLGLQAYWDRALWRLEYETGETNDTDTQFVSLQIGWQF